MVGLDAVSGMAESNPSGELTFDEAFEIYILAYPNSTDLKNWAAGEEDLCLALGLAVGYVQPVGFSDVTIAQRFYHATLQRRDELSRVVR